MDNSLVSLPIQSIVSKIYFIRGKKVMIDEDLAEIYGVLTKEFNRSVKRNISRFPEDFMFTLSKSEYADLRFQFGTSSWGGRRYMPRAFTEQGVEMLSSVLHSERAIQMNIQIVRTFSKLKEIILENKELSEKIEKMESKYDKQIADIFEVIKYLVKEDEKPKEKMGFDVQK